MNYFESNMAVIKQYQDGLYEKVIKIAQNYKEASSVTVMSDQALNGEKFLLVQKGNVLYRLNSSYSPANEAEKWVKQYSFTKYNAVISMFGLGSGVFARELIKNKGENDALIIYEPSIDIFLHVLQNYDISDILAHEKTFLCVEEINEYDFHKALRMFVNITNIKSQIKCTHPFYQDLFPEKAIYYWSEIKDNYIHELLNINTERVFGKRFIINSLYNSRYIKDSIRLNDLKEVINPEIPAIIVAAGPSVMYNLEELKKAKKRAYIFVVDRILDYILDSGIEPDFIATVDPIKPIEYFTKRTDVTAPLLCELVANWEVLDRHKGKKIIYNCKPFFQHMYSSQNKEAPVISIGGSVATAAFSACVNMGFKRIVLVGQDLAYDGDLTHAGGIAENSVKQDIFVEGINGEKVRSRHDWYEFLNWFKDTIKSNPDIEVIDTKTKGAKIEGTKLMSLKDVLDIYGVDRHDSKLIDDNFRTFTDEEMDSIRKFFRDAYEELNTLKKKAKEAIQICEDQIGYYMNNMTDSNFSESNFSKLSKINEYIENQPVYYLIDTFITSETVQQITDMYSFTDDEIRNKIDTLEKSLAIFKAIVDGADFAREIFENNMEYI